MGYSEKSAWIMLFVEVTTYALYLGIMLTRLGDAPLVDLPFVWPMAISIGVCIVLLATLHTAVGIRHWNDVVRSDERDHEIGRFGDNVGQSMLVIGGGVALVLAMAEADHFWIANTLFLAFTLAGILEAAAKLEAYRRGFIG